jgi:hypothetical protein
MPNKQIPEDRLIDLSNKIGLLPRRSSEVRRIVEDFAGLLTDSLQNMVETQATGQK